jgi:hypothetical protein
MSTKLKRGSGIDKDLAEELLGAAGPYLQPDEVVKSLVLGPKLAADLLVLTDARFLMLNTRGEGRLQDSFDLGQVISVRTSFNDGDPILQVPLTDNGYFLIRLRDVGDREFLAQKMRTSRRGVEIRLLMSQRVQSLCPV